MNVNGPNRIPVSQWDRQFPHSEKKRRRSRDCMRNEMRRAIWRVDGLQISVIELLKTRYHALCVPKDAQIAWPDLIRRMGRNENWLGDQISPLAGRRGGIEWQLRVCRGSFPRRARSSTGVGAYPKEMKLLTLANQIKPNVYKFERVLWLYFYFMAIFPPQI
jgi:hypothetical protein